MRRPLVCRLRDASATAGLALLALVAACEEEPPQPRQVSEAEARARRLRCEFKAGARIADTVHTSARTGSAIPLDHIVLVMQENRSFDHYFSQLAATNLDASSQPVERYHETKLCRWDQSHGWNASHRQWGEGRMDGFVLSAEPGGSRAMGYYTEAELPFYHGLARAFATSDMHFCSLLGGTWPNRMFYLGASSWGVITNRVAPFAEGGKNYPTLFTLLEAAGVSWKIYAESQPTLALFLTQLADLQSHVHPLGDYFTDAAADTLPAVSMVEAVYSGGDAVRDDEHPPGNVQLGQKWSADVIQAILHSPGWRRSALIFTYDEHGGFYDHVPPPPACVPDALPPALEPGDAEGAFDRYGFRVPLVVVSPFAKRGYVSHQITDHTSILRFVEARFDLPALTARDANAEPLYDLFDFDHPHDDVPPLPEAVLDPVRHADCVNEFP